LTFCLSDSAPFLKKEKKRKEKSGGPAPCLGAKKIS